MAFVVSIIFLAYIIFAIIYVILVKIFSKKKRAWLRSLIFFILFPTWDVLIAFIIFIPSALFWSGDTIYEKVKTDTIHYDVYYDRMGVIESTKNEFFYKGFKYVEMEITRDYSSLPPMGLYRYWLDKDKNIQYQKISEVGARYTIKYKKPIKLPIIPIKFGRMDIIDRQENKIIASGRGVWVSYIGFGFSIIPCFNWLHWYDYGYKTIASNIDFDEIDTKVINSD